jgi:Tol biopolymer transport system component
MGATGHGTFSFATLKPDGSDPEVISPPIETLNLGPGTPSLDGRWIAFDGWDETDPSRNGVYLGGPDLTDLRFVTPLPDGTVRTEPFGVTPDGAHVLFFADRGETEHAAGDLYVVNADGTGLRQLNPPGTTHNFVDVPAGSLAPDGRQAAFGVNDGTEEALFVVNIEGGQAEQITESAGGVWAVSWSPTGDWITYTRQHGTTPVVSLVRPDGTDQEEISATEGSDRAAGAVWSPTGDALLVIRRSNAGEDMWIMDLGGNYISQVTHEPADYGSYSWAPAS